MAHIPGLNFQNEELNSNLWVPYVCLLLANVGPRAKNKWLRVV